jgi:hypothetical protein
LVDRAQREADKRGIALKQLVDDALERKLTGEGTHGRARWLRLGSEVERRSGAAERLRGLFADVAPDKNMADELIAERRAEAHAEDRADEIRRRCRRDR